MIRIDTHLIYVRARGEPCIIQLNKIRVVSALGPPAEGFLRTGSWGEQGDARQNDQKPAGSF